MRVDNQFICKGVIISLLTPVLLVIVSWAYFYRARLNLGYWPTYGNPDPKQLEWWIQHSLIYVLVFLCYPAVVWIAFSSAVLSWKRQFGRALSVVVFGVFSFGIVAFASTTKFGNQFWGWFLD